MQVTSKKSTNRINLILNQPELSKQNISNTLDKSMWHLHNMTKVVSSSIKREYSFGQREYPSIEMTCQVFRKCEYYHWNALLPILLITICSLSPFVLDSNATASRLGNFYRTTRRLGNKIFKRSIKINRYNSFNVAQLC